MCVTSSSFYLWIATTADSGAITGIVIGTIFGFLLIVGCVITICVVIAYRVTKRRSNTKIRTRTVTPPKGTTTTTDIELPTTTNIPTPPETLHSKTKTKVPAAENPKKPKAAQVWISIFVKLSEILMPYNPQNQVPYKSIPFIIRCCFFLILFLDLIPTPSL